MYLIIDSQWSHFEWLSISSQFCPPSCNLRPTLPFNLGFGFSSLSATPSTATPVSSGSIRDLRRICVRKPEEFVLSEFCCNFNLFFFFSLNTSVGCVCLESGVFAHLSWPDGCCRPDLHRIHKWSCCWKTYFFLSLMINDRRQFDVSVKRWHRCMELSH